MSLSRRALGAALAGGLAAPRLARGQSPIRLRDVLGRAVSLPRPARRIVLTEGRHLAVLGLLHPDPVPLLAGWRDDFRRGLPAEYAPWTARFPGVEAVPRFAAASEDLSVEALLSVSPDLVLFSRWSSGDATGMPTPLIGRLEAAGIPVAVVDFFVQPFRDTDPSLDLLGRLLGREEQAAALAAFRRERLEAVATRLAGLSERPLVMLHAHAGAAPCCASPGRGTFDDLIRAAGGASLGAELLPGVLGSINPEMLLARDPPVYVATGGAFGGRGLRLGAGVGEAEARDGLARLLAEPPLSGLSAARDGRAHAIWHGFNDTPAHVLMVEALARWIHPERCGDLDPRRTMEALNARFAAVPMEGAYWV